MRPNTPSAKSSLASEATLELHPYRLAGELLRTRSEVSHFSIPPTPPLLRKTADRQTESDHAVLFANDHQLWPSEFTQFLAGARLWLPDFQSTEKEKTKQTGVKQFQQYITAEMKQKCGSLRGNEAYGFFVNSQIANALVENTPTGELQVSREVAIAKNSRKRCDVMFTHPKLFGIFETDNARSDQYAKSAWLYTPRLWQFRSLKKFQKLYVCMFYWTDDESRKKLRTAFSDATETFARYLKETSAPFSMMVLKLARDENMQAIKTHLILRQEQKLGKGGGTSWLLLPEKCDGRGLP